jgi:hypothetical protein
MEEGPRGRARSKRKGWNRKREGRRDERKSNEEEQRGGWMRTQGGDRRGHEEKSEFRVEIGGEGDRNK